ncbi:MAG: hypothetical protein WAN61_04175 [Minisyncoccia bacterium]
MTEKLKNIIQEEIVKLPKETRIAIEAFDWAGAAETIGKKYLLDEKEINDFQVETMLVLFGIEEPDLYAINIENQVGTTKDDAEKMAAEAYEKIFLPINNVFVENIKKNGKDKNAKPEQNLDFILSGGNYAAFVNPPLLSEEGAGGGDSNNNHLAFGTPPSKGGEGNSPKRITDIKSKFTI